jgi:hypothetical protein
MREWSTRDLRNDCGDRVPRFNDELTGKADQALMTTF